MFGKTNPTLTERDVLQALKGVEDRTWAETWWISA